MRTFTEDQINQHGDLIVKQIRDGVEIQWYNTGAKEWELCEHPVFVTNDKYREQPEPLYVNSIGERFELGEDVWIYGFNGQGLDDVLINMIIQYEGNEKCTEIFKTKSGALQAATDYYKNKGE